MPDAKPARTAKASASAAGGASASGFSLPLGRRTRYVIAALAVLSGVASGVYSLGSAMARRSIDLAYAVDPSNPVIAGRFALSEVSNPIQGDRPTNFREVAARALEQDPTAVDAAVAIGLASQLNNQPAQTDEAFAYALRMSRRETRAHIWAIEQAAMRGDIRGALEHYDLALRTEENATDVLFPTLASAASEPLVRKELIRLFRSDPPWGQNFINVAAMSASTPKDIALLVEELRRAGTKTAYPADQLLATNLYNRGFRQDAWDYYTSRINRKPGMIRPFSQTRAYSTSFDWKLDEPTGILPTIIRSGDDYVLDVSKVPSSSGAVASQALRLAPGHYRLAGSFEAPQGSDRSAYRWEIACTDGQPFAMVDLAEGQGTQAYRTAFTVPADCPQQTLTLTARQSSGFQAQNTSFASPTITRVGAGSN